MCDYSWISYYILFIICIFDLVVDFVQNLLVIFTNSIIFVMSFIQIVSMGLQRENLCQSLRTEKFEKKLLLIRTQYE